MDIGQVLDEIIVCVCTRYTWEKMIALAEMRPSVQNNHFSCLLCQRLELDRSIKEKGHLGLRSHWTCMRLMASTCRGCRHSLNQDKK